MFMTIVDFMNASSLKKIIDLLHIGDDLLVVLMAAEFEETLLGLRGPKTQDCLGTTIWIPPPKKNKKKYIYIYIYINILCI